MNKIKLAVAFIAGLLLSSCTKDGDALLYENYNFVSIKGDSVISADGLEMVASVVDVYQIADQGSFGELESQVTVGNNVFNLDLLIVGANAGKHTMKHDPDDYYGYIGSVSYRTMQADQSFRTYEYAILNSTVEWEDIDSKNVLLNVSCQGQRMLNDSTLGKAKISIEGKIKAIKQ